LDPLSQVPDVGSVAAELFSLILFPHHQMFPAMKTPAWAELDGLEAQRLESDLQFRRCNKKTANEGSIWSRFASK